MLQISRELYDKETLLKAAYALTDKTYIHLDADKNYYYIEFFPKEETLPDDIEFKFENELIAQQTRRTISNKTKSIREMIVARALASTIVDTGLSDEQDDTGFSADDILKDWFDEHENTAAT